MADSGAQSSWLKLNHGREQFDQLESEISAWMGAHQGELPWRARPEYDPDLQCMRFFVDNLEPMPSRWGLSLADALHNVRCVLDHVDWHLVGNGSSPPTNSRDERSIGFPVYDNASRFTNAVRSRIPGVSTTQQAIIEQHQPYHLGIGAAGHPLALLQELNNTDKHRELRTLAAAQSPPFRFDVISPMGSKVERLELAPAFNDDPIFKLGKELVRVYGQFADGEMLVAFVGETGIALDNGLDPKTTFEAIHVEVTDIVQALEATM